MTDLPMTKADDDLVERLRSNEPLPACPFDRISPHYLTMPDDKPCPFCGQENTLEGPDKCRGADTRIFGDAADAITRLRAQLAASEGERDDLRIAVSGLNKDWNAAMSQLQAMRKALEETRAIVVDAALVGFNYKSGDWAERLFANQGNITQALRSLTEG